MRRLVMILMMLALSTTAASVCEGVGVVVTDSFMVRSSYDDGFNKYYNGAANMNSAYAYIGNGQYIGWRFEGISVPPGAEVKEAVLEVFCYNEANSLLSIRYVGEAADDAAPFSGASYEMFNRPKTAAGIWDAPEPWLKMYWNRSPDISSILQEIVDRPGWKPGNALAIFADGGSSPGKRSVLMRDKSEGYAARLHISYVVMQIDFDTDGDGHPDITMRDTDGDGYFEAPIGKTEYKGTLVIDQPIEIMGFPATRTETLFKGDGFLLKDGGTVISDLTSPVVSSAFPGLKGNDFQVVCRNFIGIEYDAKILLGGVSEDFDGDIYLETTRVGADIVIKEDSFIHGRQIKIISNGGSVSLRQNTAIRGNSHLTFRAELWGDIRLNRDVSVSTSSLDGDCFMTFIVKDGDLHMNRNILLNADVIDFCGISGHIWEDGTVTLTGTTECW